MPRQLASLDPTIFRAYDIRGIVGDSLTEDVVFAIGSAYAKRLQKEQLPLRCVLGGDARPSSAGFRRALATSLMDKGVDVVDLGAVTTPILYFATHYLEIPNGIMITGSHNATEYNGLKINKNFVSMAGRELESLRDSIQESDFTRRRKHPLGKLSQHPKFAEHYVEFICEQITLDRRLKVVVDCGNGIAGNTSPELFRRIGCEVVPLFCEIDGRFPNHHPDPTRPENLMQLIDKVKETKADIGVAFDGDGDRLGVVTDQGEIIWSDRLLAFLATQLLKSDHDSRAVVYDVKCSSTLATSIEQAGGVPVIWKTGHTHIKQKLLEEKAILGAEFSGHICFVDEWFGFDDGTYAAARLLKYLASQPAPASEVFAEFPQQVATPELFLELPEKEKFLVVNALGDHPFTGDRVLLDGIRVEYEDGFGLVRASNTSPKLTLRFEGSSSSSVERIHLEFKQAVASVNPVYDFPELTYV